jgi:hypothetical protein
MTDLENSGMISVRECQGRKANEKYPEAKNSL